MGFTGHSIGFGFGATAAMVACSGASHSAPPTDTSGSVDGATPSVGQVEAQVTTNPAGLGLGPIAYSLTGRAETYTGTLPLQGNPDGGIVIHGVAAAAGYALTLHALTADGALSCANATPVTVDVLEGRTALVPVTLTCTSAVTGVDCGCLIVNLTQPVCPEWTGLGVGLLDGGEAAGDAAPVDAAAGILDSSATLDSLDGTTANEAGLPIDAGALLAGQSATLVVYAIGPDPSELAIQWSATGGTLDGLAGVWNTARSENQNVFACPTGQPATTYTITYVVSDGPVADAADASSCPANVTTGRVQFTCQ